ncbi:Peroxidasin-Like Protein [Manis pentadactyla]|nr:Peroxidasin-Like Protein [Manis pentadactyla]
MLLQRDQSRTAQKRYRSKMQKRNTHYCCLHQDLHFWTPAVKRTFFSSGRTCSFLACFKLHSQRQVDKTSWPPQA